MLHVEPNDRASLIDPLYKSSVGLWALMGVLVAAMGWGVFMYIRQITMGMGETGMQRPVFWGMYMVNFIFFIGISHAGTLISAILRVTGAEWRRPITRVAETITAVALIVGTLQIIIDMGRPDRLINVILKGRLQSPILWDVVSVTAYFLGSVTYLYLPLIPDVALLRDNLPANSPQWRRRLYTLLSLNWRGNQTQWLRLEKIIGIMAVLIIPIAVSVHTIISWILATTVQPGWHSTIFGPYFVVGAIFSGIGALFVAMTAVRKIMGLEDYITVRQYQNLGMIFITMNVIWMYFTYAEHLTLAAGQGVHEIPVLASKLWEEFAPSFWIMVLLMLTAFWITVASQLIPDIARRFVLFQPRFALGSAVVAGVALFLLVNKPDTPIPALLGLDAASFRTLLWNLMSVALVLCALGAAVWFKTRQVTSNLIAAVLVIVGMWLERWNIIIPTMTHPYLVKYSRYTPTLTEISLTVASIALFVFMFVVFFKLFPVISIWEVVEGRVIEETRAKNVSPMPKPSNVVRRRGFRRKDKKESNA
jgi:molybdopterin-containing oxidoreductase family membrane subunit